MGGELGRGGEGKIVPLTGSWIWVNTRPNPQSRLMCMRCPLGPSPDPRSVGDAVTDSNGRTLGLVQFPDLALWSKNELSLDSSSLTEESDESTSGFHAPNDLSNSVATDSRVTKRFSCYCSARVNLASRAAKTTSCVTNSSFISMCMDWISFMSSSNMSLVFGSITPNLCFCLV
jgi:hypothetical protein